MADSVVYVAYSLIIWWYEFCMSIFRTAINDCPGVSRFNAPYNGRYSLQVDDDLSSHHGICGEYFCRVCSFCLAWRYKG